MNQNTSGSREAEEAQPFQSRQKTEEEQTEYPGTEHQVEPSNLPVVSTGWEGRNQDVVPIVGKKGRIPENRLYALDKLVGPGSFDFELIKHKKGVTKYITSSECLKIMAVSVPSPVQDPTWQPAMKDAAKSCWEWREECRFADDQGRRGPFDALYCGMSIGNGQLEPMVLSDQGTRNLKVLDKVRKHAAFRRIAGWMTVCFACWAPLLFQYYLLIVTELLKHHTGLELPFDNAVFAAFAINFGPQTVCLPHCDPKNLAFGWCAITALGDFDYHKGGHLVLWDLGIVLEFPPGKFSCQSFLHFGSEVTSFSGSTIFIPSAVICHSNTTIAPGEERFSFTMYSAGGLFRWVEHGFQLEYKYRKTVEAVKNAAKDGARWVSGLSLFSTFAELKALAV
ncbi:hypothetical protein V5O48_013481 [Marasmius crinis-equi]|uniref:Uncharacterized protein n=1 Tax=Marasmius crinis-equi TaxID=585013 RepID=A0ABR3EZY3_9AGAR